jgi:hypothetical protein
MTRRRSNAMSVSPEEAENIHYAIELDQTIKTQEIIKENKKTEVRSLYKDIMRLLSCYKH